MRLILFLLCGALVSCAGVPSGEDSRTVAGASSRAELNYLMSMLEGEFRSANPEAGKAVDGSADEPLLWDRRVRVSAPALGEYVVYLQLNTGAEAKLYRQVLMVFTLQDSGIVQSAWRLKSPERFADAFGKPGLFVDLDYQQLERSLPEGCEQHWTREGVNWHGHTRPGTCRIWSERRQAWRRIEAETRITNNALFQAERGFDDEGNQVFGTTAGELYRLHRLGGSLSRF